MSLASLLGCEYPIVQAPMAGVQGSALAIAVSAAGGLGSLPCATLGPDALAGELAAICDAGNAPFNVNFFCHSTSQPDAGREALWRVSLAGYYDEFGIDADSIVDAPGRRPFDGETAELIEAWAPPVVSFHFGLPSPKLLKQVKAWGACVMSSATTVAEARWLEAHGADVIIAQGLEAGGHRGHFLDADLTLQSGLFALLPQIVAAVDVPVLAAGGIADAGCVRAAMALGAAGVQAGTAYLLCPEAGTRAVHREALQSEAARHTALTNLFSGRPARGIVNRFIREHGPLSDLAPDFPLAATATTPLRDAAEKRGSSDFSQLWAGQNASACHAAPAAEITRALVEGLPRV